MANQSLITTQKNRRAFTQVGGARPNNPLRYGGQDEQFIALSGVEIPQGETSAINNHDPHKIGRYVQVGSSETAPDFATGSIMLRERSGYIPRALYNVGCRVNAYEMIGTCRDLSDPNNGWSEYVLIYADGKITNTSLGDRVTFDSDDAVETTQSVTWRGGVYPYGPLAFGEIGAGAITAEIADATYGNQELCGDCGPENDGTKWVYAVTAGDGALVAPAVIYSVDGGATATALPITGIVATEVAVKILTVGSYLVVVTDTAGGATISGYYVSQINDLTGIPDATFTKVTAGFTATHLVTDAYSLSPRETFFVGEDGYIWKAEDILTGVEVINDGAATMADLARISGDGQKTLVAVGATSAFIVSLDRGATWSALAPSGTPATLTAVAVLDDLRYWIGGDGNLFYTLDGGQTLTQLAFSGDGAGTVNDIVFATDEVGYFSHTTTAPLARVFSIFAGGALLSGAGSARFKVVPTEDRFNRLAVPQAGERGVRANNLLLAGLAADGTDGILYKATTAVL